MAEEKSHLKGIASRWVGRTLATTRVAASAGRAAAKAVVNRALDRGDEGEEASAEFIAERLDELKGLSMKLGQMASLVDGPVSEKFQRAFARLQSESKPMEWPLVEAVLRDAYKKPLGDVFETFEQNPFAAASIGQVHRAALAGRPLAVKIQYPEVARAIEIDLGNIGQFAFLKGLGTAMATGPLLDELRARLLEECDYRQEAAQQLLFRERFADEPRAVIPGVVPELCRERVLVSERIDGLPFRAFSESATESGRNAAGELMFTFAFRSIFSESMFNGDPHPGNYLFLPDGRVAFLDYGCVRVFEGEFIARWKRFALSILDNNRAVFPDRCRDLGIIGSDAKFDYDHQWDLMLHLYEPMRSRRFRFSRDYAKKTWDVMLWNNPNLRHSAVPPELLLINRLQWGLYSVLASLSAEGDFKNPFREIIESPSRTTVRPPPIEG